MPRGARNDRRRPRDLMRVGHRIRVPEVRVVLDNGEQRGIMPTREAQALAEEMGLELVEISPRSRPPVCRIMDYGKFKYQQSKKKREQKARQSTVELKEIKFRPKTEGHDMDFKIKHVRRFLEEGNKCRLVIIFRGREITHPETGIAVLNRVVEATSEIANVEVRPNMEGRRMVMIMAPKAGVVRRQRQQAKDSRAAGDGKGAGERAEASGESAEDRDEYVEDVVDDEDDDEEGDTAGT